MRTWSNSGIMRIAAAVPVGIAILTGLYLTSLFSYLLFHAIAELFSIVIAVTIFLIVWNARKYLENTYLLFIGIAYLFVAGLDLLHTLAYKGMGVFPGRSVDLATQLWTAARYLQAVTLLAAPWFLSRKLNAKFAFGAFSMVSGLLIISIFDWKVFPVCFVEGSGLTAFKKVSEYVICALLAGAGALHLRQRKEFDSHVLSLLLASIGAAVITEMVFTFYIGVSDIANMAGHFFKILSFFFMYQAIIQTAVVKPYDIVFRKLKQSEDALRTERDELLKSLETIKVLTGLLPMCAACKKIRDDKGYWSRVETYIEKHSDAQFTHGLCPDCAIKLYPKLFEGVDFKKLK